MSLLEKIHEWSLTQKPCVSDALRRLLDTPTLSSEDYDDLFALLKLEAGIPDEKNRVPVPLDKSHLPAVVSAGSFARLLSIKNLKNVNRLAPGQKLEFDPSGLTVIYGDNGTGKSGYSRVLKLACRARGEKSAVLPNAHIKKDDQGSPEADLVFDLNGTKKTLKWTAKVNEHSELSSISVFDSHCARAYVDEEQDVAYLPYGLDIVENLAKVVLPELKRRLDKAIGDCAVDLTEFEDLTGKTKVGEMIAKLSADTDLKLAETLTTFTDEDAKQQAALVSTLREQNPKERAIQLRRLAGRIKSLKEAIDTTAESVNKEAVDALQTFVTDTTKAIQAETLARDLFQSGEKLLPSTGCEEWQTLFEAAREYASLAYEDKQFPPTGVAKCPLCQQELKDGTERLKRFDAFIKDTAATVANTKRAAFGKARKTLETTKLGISIEASLGEELDHLAPEVRLAIAELAKTLEKRRTWMLDSSKTNVWEGEPLIEGDPRPRLLGLSTRLIEQATEHELAADEETRKKLQDELAELEARYKCKKKKVHILKAIAKYTMAGILENCTEILKTGPISTKSKELAKNAVTVELEKALDEEFVALDVGHIKTKLKPRAEEGKTYHKILLDVPNKCKVSDVLSEGELRVMAIASFLAELSLANHPGAAIFDDPVSSLDHFRRISVARRLAKESDKRQVIVFTHDTVFLSELRGMVEREGLKAKFYHLEWTTGEYAGYCNAGLPWHHQSFDSRINDLEQEQRKLDSDWIANPPAALCDRMRTAYSHFRAAIEIAVENVFLNGVVRRFENYVPVKNIEKIISLTAAECDELDRLFKLASNITNAHSSGMAANRTPPTPAVFAGHINDLKTLVLAFQNRRTALRQAAAAAS